MVGVSPPTNESTVHVIDGGVSPRHLVEFSQVHERAGFDKVLVGYTSTSADGWSVATHAAAHTESLGYLIAHRPGFVSPTLAARKAATFDQLSGGRFALHIIAGASDQDQRRDGDYMDKSERYSRAAEYVGLMRRTWTSTDPFDHSGTYYECSDVRSDVRPLQAPTPPVFFGGSSAEAIEMGAEHCDVYAVFGEPLAATAERFDSYRTRAAHYGRDASFSVSLRVILGDTEGQAWDRAYRILDSIQGRESTAVLDHGAERMLAHAADGEIHDERLFMGIAAATGARGNTSCLVGTPEQVADSILRYYALGDLRYVLIRGFDPVNDAAEYGRELIPRVKDGALAMDAIEAAR